MREADTYGRPVQLARLRRNDGWLWSLIFLLEAYRGKPARPVQAE